MTFTDRRTVRVPLPPTDKELAAFNAWKTRYESARDEGYEKDWLSYYTDDGDVIQEPHPSGYEERLETDEEYELRINGPFAGIAAVFEKTYAEFVEKEFARQRFVLDHILYGRGVPVGEFWHYEPKLEVPDVDLTARGGTVTFPVVKRDSFGRTP